ncbi:MAG: SPASM domain-containing protein, partial [Candidatus Pacearchaeota archaeon]|nr:SPASM domain-containing protein [Candidatus Pacearchaeota archaeon]
AVSIIQKIVNKYPCFRNEWFYRTMPRYIKDPSGFRIPCYAGMTFAYIDPYWEVYPCTNFSVSMGNLRDFNFDLSKLWNSKKAKEVQMLVKKDKCPNCWSNCAIISSRVSNPKLLISHYLGLKNDK